MLLDPQAFLIELAGYFNAGSPALETERSLYQSLLQQTTKQSLLTLIGKADRITLCRSLCDQMLHQQTALLQQLHWLAPDDAAGSARQLVRGVSRAGIQTRSYLPRGLTSNIALVGVNF